MIRAFRLSRRKKVDGSVGAACVDTVLARPPFCCNTVTHPKNLTRKKKTENSSSYGIQHMTRIFKTNIITWHDIITCHESSIISYDTNHMIRTPKNKNTNFYYINLWTHTYIYIYIYILWVCEVYICISMGSEPFVTTKENKNKEWRSNKIKEEED